MDTSQSIPLSLAAFFGVACGLGSLWFFVRSSGWKKWSSALGVLLIFPVSLFFTLALNPWMGDSRFRAFRSLYYDLEEGMTRAEVAAEIERHYPDSGRRGRPSENINEKDRLMLFMNTEDGSHTCEGIFIGFRDDVVTGVSYSCD